MWRIVAMGAVPAALLGAGTGLFYSHNFVAYEPMGQLYLAQDSISSTGAPPPNIAQAIGGSGPFYVAPGQATFEPAPSEPSDAERPAEGALTATSPSAADRAADASAIEPVQPPENPTPQRQAGDAIKSAFDARTQAVEHELKKEEAPPVITNLDAPP
ncbi:MAG: hypothetical protein JWM33_1818 [Caulobacteraceae bacterium]|nr:hypothetical protein [Caulobacteraceae bacterium]